jgi:HD-like signal output (HDOD) protein
LIVLLQNEAFNLLIHARIQLYKEEIMGIVAFFSDFFGLNTHTRPEKAMEITSYRQLAKPAVVKKPIVTATETQYALPHWYVQRIENPNMWFKGAPVTLIEFEEPDSALEDALLREIRGLLAISPSFPTLYKVLNSPKSTAKDIADLVKNDPVLAARILKTVNSSYFALPKKVGCVGRAIVLLGYNNIKNLMLSHHFGKNALPNTQTETLRSIWVHSTMTSALVTHIAQNHPELNGANLATKALLHDLGKILISHPRFRHVCERLPKLWPESVKHAYLGGLWTRSWGLDSDVSDVITQSARLPFIKPRVWTRAFLKETAVIHFASYYTNLMGFNDGDALIAPRVDYLQLLGITSAEPKDWVSPQALMEMEKSRLVVEGVFEIQGN